LALVAHAQTPDAAEWPQFLGPHRNGLSNERNLLESWPAGGPKELWRAKGGVGMSGLAISRGRLLTLVQTEGQQRIVALDAQTGQPLWQTAIAPAYANPMGDGPRATPAIAGQRAFAFSGEGVLACVSFSDGRLQWSHNLFEELGGKPADYGVACSPLIVGDLVVVTPGAPQAAVVAVDAADGKVVWKAGSDPAGYSSPALLTLGGHQQIVAFMGNSVLGLAPSSGELLWRYSYVTDFNCNIATPLAHEGRVFISSGENHGSALLGLKESGGKGRCGLRWAPGACFATSGRLPSCWMVIYMASTMSAAPARSRISPA
jgi:outer membrane protein assembly factor BamB